MKNSPLKSKVFDKYIIILLSIISYHNSFSSGWYYDGKTIYNAIKGVAWPVSLQYFMAIDSATYIGYIGHLSFYLNQFIFVNGIWEYHLINLIIHTLNALLIYKLILLTYQTPWFELTTPFDSPFIKGEKEANSPLIKLTVGHFFAGQEIAFMSFYILASTCLPPFVAPSLMPYLQVE